MKRVPFYEDEHTEFKECSGRFKAKLPDDLWQSIAAFSNSHGGTIFLGVLDDGKIAPLSEKDLDKLQKDSSVLISNSFNVKPKVEIQLIKNYIKLIVREAEFYNKPLYSKKVGPKKIYIRQGSTNVVATNEEMKSLFAGASGGGENQVVSGEASAIVDETKIDSYISQTGLRQISFSNIKEKLAKVKALRDDALTMFGLIAFAKDGLVDDLTNNIYIDFRIFSGHNKIDSNNLAHIYQERKEFHGDIKSQFNAAFEYIKAKLPTEAILNKETGLREDRIIIPEDALREALANALAHRDYLIRSTCVNIDLFADRIEILNPGESLVAIKDLEKASSKARNPNLMEYLKAYNITDKTARGIPTIYKTTRAKGLLDPKFENISGCFKVTLYFSPPYTSQDREWAEKIAKHYALKDTQKNALVYIKNNSTISNKRYCEINHMNQRNDDRRARRELGELIEKGLIEMVGVGPGTKYQLTDI